MLTPAEQVEFDKLVLDIEQEKLRRMDAEVRLSQASGFHQSKDANIIEYQLDPSLILDRIYHLLSGHVRTRNANGEEDWEEPDDDRLKVFSEYGVKQIMSVLSNYISHDMLLGKLDEDKVYSITSNFGANIADDIYCGYEDFFYYPSPEEMFELYLPIMKKLKLDITEGELYYRCVEWSREELQKKFKNYYFYVDMLVDKVYVNLTRAINGEERKSLRTQYNIHQSLSDRSQIDPNNKVVQSQKRW